MSSIDLLKKVIFANLVTYEVLHGQRRYQTLSWKDSYFIFYIIFYFISSIFLPYFLSSIYSSIRETCRLNNVYFTATCNAAVVVCVCQHVRCTVSPATQTVPACVTSVWPTTCLTAHTTTARVSSSRYVLSGVERWKLSQVPKVGGNGVLQSPPDIIGNPTALGGLLLKSQGGHFRVNLTYFIFLF